MANDNLSLGVGRQVSSATSDRRRVSTPSEGTGVEAQSQMLDLIRTIFCGAAIEDIEVAGFVDLDQRLLQFYASYRSVSFVCRSAIFCASAIKYTGAMQSSRVDSLSFHNFDEEVPRSRQTGKKNRYLAAKAAHGAFRAVNDE